MKFLPLLVVLTLVIGAQDLSAQKAKTKPVPMAIGKGKSATATTAAPTAKAQGVHMTFDNEHLNIGKVKKGEIKNFEFVFTNTGTEAITIDIASGCDCTTLDYPKTPIKVGQKAVIKVKFDSGKKDVSETVDVDIYLKNINPKTGQRYLKVVDYKYELL
jgi:hypothetical protein